MCLFCHVIHFSSLIKKKCHIYLFQLLKCEDTLPVFALYGCKLRVLGFRLLEGQKKTFEEVILASWKLS